MFENLKEGNFVNRFVDGRFLMRLRVTGLSKTLIHCGPWTFSRKTGAEEDPELGWGDKFGTTGSYLDEK